MGPFLFPLLFPLPRTRGDAPGPLQPPPLCTSSRFCCSSRSVQLSPPSIFLSARANAFFLCFSARFSAVTGEFSGTSSPVIASASWGAWSSASSVLRCTSKWDWSVSTLACACFTNAAASWNFFSGFFGSGGCSSSDPAAELLRSGSINSLGPEPLFEPPLLVSPPLPPAGPGPPAAPAPADSCARVLEKVKYDSSPTESPAAAAPPETPPAASPGSTDANLATFLSAICRTSSFRSSLSTHTEHTPRMMKYISTLRAPFVRTKSPGENTFSCRCLTISATPRGCSARKNGARSISMANR